MLGENDRFDRFSTAVKVGVYEELGSRLLVVGVAFKYWPAEEEEEDDDDDDSFSCLRVL